MPAEMNKIFPERIFNILSIEHNTVSKKTKCCQLQFYKHFFFKILRKGNYSISPLACNISAFQLSLILKDYNGMLKIKFR